MQAAFRRSITASQRGARAWTGRRKSMRASADCYSATLNTMEACWIRPRFAGYLAFQAMGGNLIEQHLRGAMDEADAARPVAAGVRALAGRTE